MFNWVKQTVGIEEPIYGPIAIHSVAQQARELEEAGQQPYTELQKDDLKWVCMDSTNVETKTFYMISDEGTVGLAQVIYSNVMCDIPIEGFGWILC